MLDIKFILENQKLIEENCKNRRANCNLEAIKSLAEERKTLLKKVEDLRASRNANSKEKPSEENIFLMRKLGAEVKQLEAILKNIEDKLLQAVYDIPNLTHPDSPIGEEADFKVIYTSPEPKELDFEPKDHEELMTDLDLIDFGAGAKVAGSKFYYFKNQMVRLNLALINYGMDVAQKHGYSLMETPDVVKDEILEGSGFNPRGAEKQTYKIADTELNLIGTAEMTVLGYHADETLDLTDGPKKYVALSHCFRTEGGSYGQASKGLYRVHQFTKLEMFIFCQPQDSEKYHRELLDIEKEIVDGLRLPYRVIDIASADLGGPAYRKFDIEAYMYMKGDEDDKGDYGEITSTSNCTDYQARRLNIRHKTADGKKEFVHTLNGTAVVLSRFPVAIIENYQQADGSIIVPKVLQPYCGFDIIKK
ncbi:MAG: serine--tRNA ligase [Candidatus Magasanikbacteria bacterium CG10_big_fil_rev_8_21_14_0_10_40_10]|uniref:Serine--tRNA ligase n=1 Tax=Candidatus Magasanikbacteria bacterium CG10_big_fil_rev_8_21_14_0_10_40_10 TaxID=1974648 RepID=A0A2M6W4Z6_9BACT|nr:MAG: serine--tRNA ligase [Candidatus Magasanikbacteria bacterium CG10_big_fil_rev_8_21_14_0_10_40_10]